MEKHALRILSMLVLTVTLTASAVYANLGGTIRVNIPFDYSVGGKTLPAGVYAVDPTTTQGVLRIRRRDGGAAALITTREARAQRQPGQTKLVFHQYGNQYFLAQIWTAGESSGRELWKSREELDLIKNAAKNLAQNGIGPEVVCVVAE